MSQHSPFSGEIVLCSKLTFDFFHFFSGPPAQGGCGGTGGEAEEGKASAGGAQVRDGLHRPHADDGVGRGGGMAGTKDRASGPTGYPSWGHCAPVRTGMCK